MSTTIAGHEADDNGIYEWLERGNQTFLNRLVRFGGGVGDGGGADAGFAGKRRAL